jgi:hypothetical protein
LKVKDNNKGYPPPPLPLSKDKHILDEVIIHDSIIIQATKLGAHKNNNFNIPHHRIRFSLLHTLIIPSIGRLIDESSIRGHIKATFKWQRQKWQPTPTTPTKNPIRASQNCKWHAPNK